VSSAPTSSPRAIATTVIAKSVISAKRLGGMVVL